VGDYDFAYNGTCVLTFFVRDSGGNVESQEGRLAIEQGLDPGLQGDINNDGSVDLADLLIALKAITGLDTSGMIRADCATAGVDVNGDDRVGLAEVLYIMRTTLGL